VNGLSYEVLAQALKQSTEGRLHILSRMEETISVPNEDLKPHAPRIETITVDKEYIGAIIGSGGKVIQEIQEKTGTIITIEEIDKKGRVEVSSPNKENIEKAMAWIKGIITEPEMGEVYEGTVKTIVDFGAFVEFLPGKDGLLHISEIEWRRLPDMNGVLEVGQKVQVKLIEVDKRTGKYKLSRKALMPRPDSQQNSGKES
jgi:polyribonucleotide nucleotidyltransferase